MTAAAEKITTDLRAYIADLNSKLASCRSDKETFRLWCSASADLNALTKHLAVIAAFVANTNINPQVLENGNNR